MTTTPRTDYILNPLHQGARSRTGDQVDRQFVADVLAVLGDARLLLVPNLTDTTTSADRSRFAHTITWSKSVKTFDTPPARLGSGVVFDLDGVDEEGDVPDAARLRFGDGQADQPFSIVALVNPDANDTTYELLGKAASASDQEYELTISSSGYLALDLIDEVSGASIGRRYDTAIGTALAMIAATYDGGAAGTGIRLYKNATILTPVVDTGSGPYVAMVGATGALSIGARLTTK